MSSKLDFKDYLLKALATRKSKNPAYTLRAFARDLEISNQMLSQVLNGRTGLSAAAAHKMAKLLNLNSKDYEIFVTRVEASHARSTAAKRVAKEKLDSLSKDEGFTPITESVFKKFFEWHFFAIYVLAGMNGFVSKSEWVAEKLGIPEVTASQAIKMLLDAGLLKKENGKWIHGNSLLSFNADQSFPEVRHFYKSVVKKASDSIDQTPFEDRAISAGFVTLNKKDFNEAKKSIDAFRKGLIKEFAERKENGSERVYGISVQLFPISK